MEEKIIEAQEETKEEVVSPAPVEEKVEEAPVEEKPKKKLNVQMPKIFHNKVFVFVLLVVLTFIGGLLLFFMDTDNAYRNMIGVAPEKVAWLTGIFDMDVTIVTWLIFAIVSGAVFFLFFALWFGSSIKGKIKAKHKAKTGQEYSKKGNIILEVVFWVIFGLIAAGFAVGIGFMFGEVGNGIKMRFEAYGGFGGFAMATLKFILTFLLLIFCIALIPLLIAALFALFKAIVLFFGGLVGGVAKNVMKSQNFQETYAAAQAASNKINELANQLPKSISVVMDPNSPTGYSNGGGGSSIVGDMMGLGVGMAAANAIMPQIGNMMQGIGAQQPADNNTAAAPAAPSADTWDCTCGNKGVVGNFCNNCGAPRPTQESRWDCSCGQKGIFGNFCNNCGKKRGE